MSYVYCVLDGVCEIEELAEKNICPICGREGEPTEFDPNEVETYEIKFD